jgi:hypothetical protein
MIILTFFFILHSLDSSFFFFFFFFFFICQPTHITAYMIGVLSVSSGSYIFTTTYLGKSSQVNVNIPLLFPLSFSSLCDNSTEQYV